MQRTRSLYRIAALVLAAGLTACAAPQKPLYQWGSYQGKLYEYFKNDGANAGEQIGQLDTQLQKTKAMGETPPPGLNAHLALLYSKLGNDVAARQHLEAERKLFPESAAYVDFLLKKSSAATAPAAAASATAAKS